MPVRVLTPSEAPSNDLHGVDVWVESHTELTDDARSAAAALLDPEEHARARSFRSARDRDAYLLAHALRRRALSHYEDVESQAWRFAAGEHGRPVLTGPEAGERLAFSLSHTTGMVLCAVARDAELGADVEHLGPDLEIDRVIEHALAPAERLALRRCPAPERLARFYELWTLKEAYAKARGQGLSLAPERYAFDLDGEDIRLVCEPEVDADPGGWRFCCLTPGPNHQAAIAIRGLRRAAPVRVVAPAETGFQTSGPRTST